MRKLREVLRLRLEVGLSARAIARSCRLSVSTVSGYLGRVAVAKLSWPLPPDLDDDGALTRLLFSAEAHPVRSRPEPDWVASTASCGAHLVPLPEVLREDLAHARETRVAAPMDRRRVGHDVVV